MGCWNETCGITGLPILMDDPVVLTFLASVGNRNREHAGFCYINGEWSPKFLPIMGKYNDYGSVEEIEQDFNTQFILGRLKEELAEARLISTRTTGTELPGEERHTDTLDLDNFTLEDVLDAIHEDSVWLPGVRGVQPLGWMMMHRWAYDHLTQIMDRDWLGDLTLAQVVDHGREYYLKLQEHYSEQKACKKPKAIMLTWQLVVDHNNVFYCLQDRGYGMDGYGTLNGIRAYEKIFCQLADQGASVDDVQVSELILQMSKFLTLRSNMSGLRRAWRPQPGKGSQQQNLEAHLALARLTAEKIQLQLKEWAYEDGDLDDSEDDQSVA